MLDVLPQVFGCERVVGGRVFEESAICAKCGVPLAIGEVIAIDLATTPYHPVCYTEVYGVELTVAKWAADGLDKPPWVEDD